MTTPHQREKERKQAHAHLAFANPEGFLKNLEKAYVISDTHWFHTKLTAVLAPGSRREPNHVIMLQNWYETITPEDTVLHLGDVVVGISPAEINEKLPDLPGNIFLVDGNHDSFKKLEQFAARGWNLLDPFQGTYKGWTLFFTHEPISVPAGAINVHGHTHTQPGRDLQHINCSVEQQDLKPMRLTERLDKQIELLLAAGHLPVAGDTKEKGHIRRSHPDVFV